MRQLRVHLHLHVRYMHPPGTGGANPQVVFFRPVSDFKLIPGGNRYRIYAVTRKHVYITAGFAIITVSQLALGISLVAIAAMRGGKTKFWTRKSLFSSGAPMCVLRSTAPAATLRRVSSVHIFPAQAPGGRIHGDLSLLWCVEIILDPN